VVVRVRVSPGAKRPGVQGVQGDCLRVRVAARPVEGAANRELVRVLAEAFGVRVGDVTLVAGDHGREKRIQVAGVDPETARARLSGLSVDSRGRHN
jgi:uncharacterized protein (TIGR00251 family)